MDAAPLLAVIILLGGGVDGAAEPAEDHDELVQEILIGLGRTSFEQRRKAADDLVARGPSAVGPLLDALEREPSIGPPAAPPGINSCHLRRFGNITGASR